jgi:hypothetical protein
MIHEFGGMGLHPAFFFLYARDIYTYISFCTRIISDTDIVAIVAMSDPTLYTYPSPLEGYSGLEPLPKSATHSQTLDSESNRQ